VSYYKIVGDVVLPLDSPDPAPTPNSLVIDPDSCTNVGVGDRGATLSAPYSTSSVFVVRVVSENAAHEPEDTAAETVGPSSSSSPSDQVHADPDQLQ
jgi:hypothetical protein